MRKNEIRETGMNDARWNLVASYKRIDDFLQVCFIDVMKKLFLTLFLITGFFFSQTWGTSIEPPERYEGLVERDDSLYYKEFTDTPFTGEISGKTRV